MIYYRSTILACGDLAKEFFAEDVMVFFGKNTPDELCEYSVIHEHAQEPTQAIQTGDIITINKQQLKVLAVGDVANDNFKSVGHLVIKFNGSDTVEMAGDVNVACGAVPIPEAGSAFTIQREEQQ